MLDFTTTIPSCTKGLRSCRSLSSNRIHSLRPFAAPLNYLKILGCAMAIPVAGDGREETFGSCFQAPCNGGHWEYTSSKWEPAWQNGNVPGHLRTRALNNYHIEGCENCRPSSLAYHGTYIYSGYQRDYNFNDCPCIPAPCETRIPDASDLLLRCWERWRLFLQP